MNISLKLKAIIWVSIFLFITGSVLTTNSVFQQQRMLKEELKRRAYFAVNTLAKGTALSIILEDHKSLNELSDSIKQEKDVSYCIITDANGGVLAISGESLPIPPKVISWAKALEGPSMETFNIARESYFEFAAPVLVQMKKAARAPAVSKAAVRHAPCIRAI